jgi:hypothetical protein
MKSATFIVGQPEIAQAHSLYQELTAQKLALRFDRERLWYEWFRCGFELKDLRWVIAYLQREIRERRRNVGALKLSNLLQPDRFEEDLAISRVRLRSVPKPTPSPPPRSSPLSSTEHEQARQRALEVLRKIKASL